MRSSDLTAQQLRRLLKGVRRHADFYLKAWERAQANGMPLNDPFVEGICRAWNEIIHVQEVLESLARSVPTEYRPLKEPYKRSGLAARKEAWAARQQAAKDAVERERRKPHPPKPSPQ